MRMTNEWANWLLNEATGEKPNANRITALEASKLVKISGFVLDKSTWSNEDKDSIDFTIKFIPDKEFRKSISKNFGFSDDFPCWTIKVDEKNVNVGISYDKTNIDIKKIKIVNGNTKEALEKVNTLEVFEDYEKYVRKVSIKSGHGVAVTGLKEDKESSRTQVTIEQVKPGSDVWGFLNVAKLYDDDIVLDTEKKLVFNITDSIFSLWDYYIDNHNSDSSLTKDERLPEADNDKDADKKLKEEAKKLGLSISFKAIKSIKEDEDLPEEDDAIDAKKALKIAKKLSKYAEKAEDEDLEKLVGDLLAALGEEDEDEKKEEDKEKDSKSKKSESDDELDF